MKKTTKKVSYLYNRATLQHDLDEVLNVAEEINVNEQSPNEVDDQIQTLISLVETLRDDLTEKA